MKEQAAHWLEHRGLDPKLAERMGWDAVAHKDGSAWLRIPYIRNGKVVTNQYRSLDGKAFRFEKGSEVELWNVDCLLDEKLSGHPLIITEGVFDALAVKQCGFERVISVPGWTDKGGSNTDNGVNNDKRYELFKRHEVLIKSAPIIIAAVDADNVGRSLLQAISNFFEDNDVCYVDWPEDCKDANDVLLTHGQEGVVQALSHARSCDPKGGLITGFSDLPPRPERQMWKLGVQGIDDIMAFRTREISVLTGTPGAGKTTMMTWVADQLVKKHGIRIGMGLFETEPEEVLDQLCRLRGRGPLADLGKVERETIEVQLDSNFRLFHRVEDDEDTPHGMLWLRKMIHKLAARDGCNIIVIDPWNELEHMLEPGESMTNYINLCLMRLRQWAHKYDIHICLIAHPKKLEPGQEPTGYSIADSAAFYNKPGFGWTVHIVHPKPKIEEGKVPQILPPYVSFRCWKVRNRQVTGCKPRRVKLDFNEDTMSYTPISFAE